MRVNYSTSYLETEINPTEGILNYIKGKASVLITNFVTQETYSDSARLAPVTARYNHLLNRAYPQSSTSKSYSPKVPVDETQKQRYYVDYTVQAYDYVTHPDHIGMTAEEAAANNYLTEQRQSTFYDLLPPGTTVDLNSIKVTGYGSSSNSIVMTHRLEVHDNWRGTGRTMLIVHAQVPQGSGKNFYLTRSGSYSTLYTGMVLTFRLYNTWLNVQDNGERLINYAAYESHDGSLGSGYPDVATYPIPSEYRNAMMDLNNDGNPENRPKNFLYSSTEFTYAPLRAIEAGFHKHVASPESPEFGNEVTVIPGGNYTYRLRMQNMNLKMKDIIYYDVLENAFGTNEHWKGALAGVDVSHARAKGINAKVYYAVAPITDADIMGTTYHLDQNLGTVWLSEAPADLSTVRAIAVDLRRLNNGAEYIAQPGESVLFNINMTSAVENAEHNVANKIKAYNRGILNLKMSNAQGASPSNHPLRAATLSQWT